MLEITDQEFDKLISDAMDKLSPRYIARLHNVAIVYDDLPSPAQRERLQLRGGQILFGLYEGVPLPQRGGRTETMPDKITIFKLPLLAASHTLDDLRENIKHTLWHEIAHYFGLDHKRIHELEEK